MIRIDENYFRPSEVDNLIGNPQKIKKNLGWEPQISLEELVKQMVNNDQEEIKKEMLISDNFKKK